jgi:hypothetical protein
MSESIQVRLMREAVQAHKMAAEGSAAAKDLAQLFDDAIDAINKAEAYARAWEKSARECAAMVPPVGRPDLPR